MFIEIRTVGNARRLVRVSDIEMVKPEGQDQTKLWLSGDETYTLMETYDSFAERLARVTAVAR